MTVDLRRVFLSHASKDLDEVLQFDSSLRAHGVPLWRDRTDLPKGAPTSTEVDRAGREALGFVFYMTLHAAESDWVRKTELRLAIDNAKLDHSFGIVPVFRHDKDKVCERMLSLAGDGDPRHDLRSENGHVLRSAADLELTRELVAASTTVLRSTLRTLRRHAPSGQRLRIAGVTRGTKPWSSTPVDLAVDWSHCYPPTTSLPNLGIADTTLTPALAAIESAVLHEWGEKRVSIVPHCHPSMAVAMGFMFRRGTGFEIEAIDHATGERSLGPARPVEPEDGLWQVIFTEHTGGGADLAILLGVSRDITPDVARTIRERGLPVAATASFAPHGGASNASIRRTDELTLHRLAVGVNHRIAEFQRRRGVGAVHVFVAAPGPLALLLGQQLTNLGVVNVYDFDNASGRYSPTVRLCHL